MPAHRRFLAALARVGVLALVAMLATGCARRPAASGESSRPRAHTGERERADDALRPSRGPQRTLLLRGGRVLTAAGVVYERGDVLVEGDRIAAVGAQLDAPKGAEVVDVAGKTVTPGIIDTHSHIGVYAAPGFTAHSDGNEMVAPETPQARAGDGYWPQDPQIERARAGGVTSMQILPGSANLIGGRSVTVKTYRRARSLDEARFLGAPGGVKMACGENPKRVYGEKGGPATRMGNMAHMRAAFQKALEYQRSWQRYRGKLARWRAKQARGPEKNDQKDEDDGDEKDKKDKDDDDPPDPPARDDGLETLAAVLRGELLVHNHCYRADEMVLMMELATSYGFEIRSFHHAVEAYKIADRLARHGAAASVWADWWGFKAESFDGIRENAAFVAAAGGRAIIHSDSGVGIQRLNQEAAKAMHAGRRAGLDIGDDEALRWITANPAWALGVDDRVGTLEPGKHADLVVWDKGPFSVYARAERVYIEGELVFERGRVDADARSDFELGLLGEQAAPTARVTATAAATGRPGRLPFDREGARTFLVGAELRLGDGTQVQDGVIEIRGTRIVAVGGRELAARIPAGAERIDLAGKVVTPGLVAADTNLGLVEIDAETSTRDDGRAGADPVRAAYDAAAGINADSSLVQVNAIEGITSAAATPQGGLVTGRVAWIDLVAGDHRTMVARSNVAMRANLGQVVAGSRAATLATLQEVLDDARFYRDRRTAFDRRQTRDLSAHRLDLEALAPVLSREIPLVVWADRVSDMRALVALARDVRIEVAIVGGAQAWRIADELADAKLRVIVQPTRNLPGGLDQLGARLDAAAMLQAAGVEVGIGVLGEAHNVRNATQEAGIAIANGLDPGAALRAITLTIARAYGMDANYGSLAAGKVANLVVWDGDPFELSQRPSAVWIRGRAIPMTSRQTELRDRYRDVARPHSKGGRP